MYQNYLKLLEVSNKIHGDGDSRARAEGERK